MHSSPNRGVAGVTYQCGPNAGYVCTEGFYGATAAKLSGWPWSYYGGTNASYNSAGPHNCTLHAAFRIAENGVSKPSWSANASGWAQDAYAAGVPVDQTATVGSVAQWNRNHVAYVEAVTSSGIVITDDNYYYGSLAPNGGYTDQIFISRSSPAWPDNFIHFKTSGSSFLAAFEANTTSLWTAGSPGGKDWQQGMKAGTSPSITAITSGYEVAFEANTTSLWTVGTAGNKDWSLGMYAGASPTITVLLP
jgi:surface antigen